MSRLPVNCTCVCLCASRKLGLLCLTLFLPFIPLWFLFHTWTLANAGPVPVSDAEARLALLATAGVPSFDNRRFFGPPTDQTSSVAIGDMNGDGALDIVVGNYQQHNNVVYLNDGVGNFPNTVGYTRTFGTRTDYTSGVAVGDMNGDGDLDIVVGLFSPGEQNVVYLNDGAGNFNTSGYTRTFGTGVDSTTSVAVGDMNGDGALDIAVGNIGAYSYSCSCYPGEQNVVYLNDGSGNFPNTVGYTRTFGTGTDSTQSLAIGDMNGNGALDIVVGNNRQQNVVYLNDGAGNFPNTSPYIRYFGTGGNATMSVVVGDVNGDGAMDVIVGNSSEQNAVYLNDGTGNFSAARTFGTGTDTTESVAVGDMNGDGALDVVVGNWQQQNAVYLNGLAGTARLVNNPPRVALTRPHPLANANFAYTNPTLRVGTIPLTYALFDLEGDPVHAIHAEYSPDGGGRWLPAVAAAGTVTTNLATNPTQDHIYVWDVFASGFFGSSDNVAFRIEAYPSLPSRANGVPVFQYPYASATTFPFRVRGMQVRVISGTVPASNAIVYRLPAGQTLGALPFADGAGKPFRTNWLGYLQGRGQLGIGDTLFALAPITWTESYTLYYTSGTPNATGLIGTQVLTPGVQALSVTSAHPLVLFNLDVSLEWDMRKDTLFLEQLQTYLRRASELLYDWSNGQAALGNVTIYHDREHWSEAHIRIYASNRLRPNAALGGLVPTLMTETVALSTTRVITYAPGQVHMAATWNRYGESSGNLGEDWPRALAQTIAAELDVEFCYTERFVLPQHNMLYPVEYRLPPSLAQRVYGKSAVIVDDVINAGSAVRGTLADLRSCGARTVAIGTLLVLGSAAPRFFAGQDIPLESIAYLSSGLWVPSECPLCAAQMPLEDVATSGEMPTGPTTRKGI